VIYINLSDEVVAELRKLRDDGKLSPAMAASVDGIDETIAQNESDLAKAFRDKAGGDPGELECDYGARVSYSDDGGAYVMTWQWIDSEQAGLVCPHCEGPVSPESMKCLGCGGEGRLRKTEKETIPGLSACR
jgi:hypothetical protein